MGFHSLCSPCVCSESCVLEEGDTQSECLLTDIVGMQPVNGARHLNIESLYEYGSRVGVWRILKLFKRFGRSFTAFACAQVSLQLLFIDCFHDVGCNIVALDNLLWSAS